jgi:D-galactarolactone cycloisomerase
MRIQDVHAVWLHCPIPADRQHVSDFGRIASFDCTLVTIRTDDGLTGYGEAKASVGSAGSCASLVSIINGELRDMLIGRDASAISAIWESAYNGPRDHYALSRGRAFPTLGRRGLLISALSGIDMALWDLQGKRLGVPVMQLLGGKTRDAMPAYASGGWAGVDDIGAQVLGYTERGFSGVKMRVGVMDGAVRASAARVHAARAALGPDVKLMVDAHGTLSVPEAKEFCARVADCDLFWFEEPVNADDRAGLTEVRAVARMPIAAGESEFTRFDFRDLIEKRAVDVLQPDMAICGGISEGARIGALAMTYQLALAPHCWGSALSFSAALQLAFSNPASIIIEYSLGANPLLFELAEETFEVRDGSLAAPVRARIGVPPLQAFLDRRRLGARLRLLRAGARACAGQHGQFGLSGAVLSHRRAPATACDGVARQALLPRTCVFSSRRFHERIPPGAGAKPHRHRALGTHAATAGWLHADVSARPGRQPDRGVMQAWHAARRRHVLRCARGAGARGFYIRPQRPARPQAGHHAGRSRRGQQFEAVGARHDPAPRIPPPRR